MNFRILALGTLALAAVVTLTTICEIQRPPVEAHGIVDEEWPTEGRSCCRNNKSVTIAPANPIGMEFTPSVPSLVAVDISLSGVNDDGDATITVQIREDTIAGEVLITSSQVVAESIDKVILVPQFFHFDLGSTVSVETGRKYIIQVMSSNLSHGWNGGEGPTEYEGGAGIVTGQFADIDFYFRTYGEGVAPSPSPVTSVTPRPSPTIASAPSPSPRPPLTEVPPLQPTGVLLELPQTGAGDRSGGATNSGWFATAFVGAIVSAGAAWYARRRLWSIRA